MAISKRQMAVQIRKVETVVADESPYQPGTKKLKKGWRYVDGAPVKVKG